MELRYKSSFDRDLKGVNYYKDPAYHPAGSLCFGRTKAKSLCRDGLEES